MGFASWRHYCTALQYWASAKLQRWTEGASIFGRAAITLGIGQHSNLLGSILIFPYLYSSYLPFPLRIGTLFLDQRSQEATKPGLMSCFSLFWVIVFLCSWCMVILHCKKSSYLCWPRFGLNIFVVVSPSFDFVLSVPVERLAGKSISEMTYVVSTEV